MQNQKFGIELEFTGLTRGKAAGVIADYFGTSKTHEGGNYDIYSAKDRQGRVWQVMSDASIRCEKKERGRRVSASSQYSAEVVSPILGYDDMADLQEIVRQLRKAGAIANKSCGIHVHVGAENHTPQSLKNLICLTAQKEDILYKALQIDTQRLHYCKKVNQELVDVVTRRKPRTLEALADLWFAGSDYGRGNRYHESRYAGLNLHPLLSGRRKAIEFRLFNGTTHAGEVKSYIQFCLAVSHMALTKKKASSQRTVSDNEKYSMRCFLLRLGLNGDEYKTCRHHFIKNLEGNSAWRHGTPQSAPHELELAIA